MDPELQRLFELAQRARKGGVSLEEINKALQGRGAPNFAELSTMAQADQRPKEPPMKPSLLSEIGAVLSTGRMPFELPAAFGLPATRNLQEMRERAQPPIDMLRMGARGASLGLLEEGMALPALIPGGKTFGEA